MSHSEGAIAVVYMQRASVNKDNVITNKNNDMGINWSSETDKALFII